MCVHTYWCFKTPGGMGTSLDPKKGHNQSTNRQPLPANKPLNQPIITWRSNVASWKRKWPLGHRASTLVSSAVAFHHRVRMSTVRGTGFTVVSGLEKPPVDFWHRVLLWSRSPPNTWKKSYWWSDCFVHTIVCCAHSYLPLYQDECQKKCYISDWFANMVSL